MAIFCTVLSLVDFCLCDDHIESKDQKDFWALIHEKGAFRMMRNWRESRFQSSRDGSARFKEMRHLTPWTFCSSTLTFASFMRAIMNPLCTMTASDVNCSLDRLPVMYYHLAGCQTS